MGNIIEVLETQKGLLSGEGVSESMIKEAESMLDLEFAPEYKEYLKKYGIVAYRGHELTGITKSPRLNVAAVTLANRKKTPDIKGDLYVIEETNVEEMVIWQDTSGEIYCTGPNFSIKKYCNSLSEYILGKDNGK